MEIIEIKKAVKKAGAQSGLAASPFPLDEIGDTFRPGAMRPTPLNRWRRIEDELPDENCVVLVCFKRDCDGAPVRTLAYRVGPPEKQLWSTDMAYEDPNWGCVDDINVTHWMPLPEPPF